LIPDPVRGDLDAIESAAAAQACRGAAASLPACRAA
jgi:hypothetical protein